MMEQWHVTITYSGAVDAITAEDAISAAMIALTPLSEGRNGFRICEANAHLAPQQPILPTQEPHSH